MQLFCWALKRSDERKFWLAFSWNTLPGLSETTRPLCLGWSNLWREYILGTTDDKKKKKPQQNCCVGHTAIPYSTSNFFMLLPHLQDGPVHCSLALEQNLSKVAWEINVIKINLAWSNAGNCQNTSFLHYKFWVDLKCGRWCFGWLGFFTIYFPVLITGLDNKKPGNLCSALGLCTQITYPRASKSCYSQRLLKNTEMTGKVTVKVKSSNPPSYRDGRCICQRIEICACQIRVLWKMTSMGCMFPLQPFPIRPYFYLVQPQSCANWNPLWKLNQYKPDSDRGLPQSV